MTPTIPELFYDFNMPPKDGLYWASRSFDPDGDPISPQLRTGDTVRIGCRDDGVLRYGIVTDLRTENLVGVTLVQAESS